jgi:prevent-host-death family protein
MVMIYSFELRWVMKTMAAGEFKAKCLAVLDEVNETGEPVLITKRGKPVARLVTSAESSSKESPEGIFGCLRGFVSPTSDLGDLVEPIIPIEEWDHLKEEGSIFPSK